MSDEVVAEPTLAPEPFNKKERIRQVSWRGLKIILRRGTSTAYYAATIYATEPSTRGASCFSDDPNPIRFANKVMATGRTVLAYEPLPYA